MIRGSLLLALGAVAACESAPPPQPVEYAPLPSPADAGAMSDLQTQAVPSGQDVRIDATDDAYADTDPSALTDFKEPLDPYGTWVDDPDYGTVWTPNAQQTGPDFVPYESAGHWAYEDTDYTWISDYPWGWIPFHYGRWVDIGGRGWSWIPGRAYAGGWVVWRTSPDGYVGWAPMAPAWGFRHGAAFGFTERREPSHFVFRPRAEMFAPMDRARLVTGPRADERARGAVAYEHPGRVVPEGHPLAQPQMHGPEPREIGIDEGHVVRRAPEDHATMRAQTYARPRTAVPSGARAPSTHVVRTAPARAGGGGRGRH